MGITSVLGEIFSPNYSVILVVAAACFSVVAEVAAIVDDKGVKT